MGFRLEFNPVCSIIYNEWVFTESAPEYGYVLKWTPGDATTPATLDYGMDQMTIPFAYEGGSLYNNASETMLDLVMTTEATENANAHGIRVQMTPEAGSALVLEGAGVHGDFISPIATMNYVHTDGSATFNEGALNVNSEIQTAISGGNSYGAKFKQTIMGDNQDFNTYGAVIENEMYDQNGGLNAGLVINAITTGGGADGVVMGLHVDAESNNSTLVNYGGVFEAEGGLMNFGVYATVNGTVVTDMANITPSVTNIALVAYADDTANELALYAHGNSEIEGTLLVEENLEVMGNGLIDDDFEVNGMTTLNGGLTITGDVNVDGNIAATGTVTGTNVLADNEIRLAAVEAGLAQEILDRIADVDAEEARALAAEALLQSNIDDEVARAMAAEAVLQANIDAEEARALAAEAVLQANIDAVAADLAQEILDRIADVDAEEARALAAEAALQAALDQEILDRIADVDTEEARAMAAEAALQAQIDAMAISFTSDEIIANNSLTSNGTLDVYGETQLMDYTAIFADLDVFGGSIFTDGDVTAAGDMAATNMVADMMGAAVAEFATSLTVGTNTLVADATAGTVGITADLTVEGMSAFTGTTTIGGIATDMFTVNIPADFNEATTIDNTLDVTGNTTVTGTFDVTGNTTVTGTVDVTGNTMITGTLGVTDLATFNSGIQLDAPVYAYVDGNPSAHAGFAGNVFVSRGAGNSPEWTNEIPELTVENLAATTDFAILDAPNSPVMEVSPTSGRFVQFGAPGAANQVTVEVNGSMTVDNLTALNVPFISIEDCEITNSLTMIGADIDLNMNNINNVAALDMDGNINMNNHDINNVRDIEATNVSISNEFQVGPSTSPVLFADGSANTLVVNGGADLDVRTTIKNTEGTNALVLDDAVEVTGNLAVQTTTTAAFVSTTDMATADMSSYTTFIYTGANPVSAIAAGTEGQIIYLLNNTGANLDVLGLATLADKQMTVLVYVGGNWYVR
jgi:cytoskeletal protein CcmA (bactofilin family)